MKTTEFYKGHRWSNEELKILMRMWADGHEVPVIAHEIGVGRSAVFKMVVRLRQQGIPLQRRQKGHVSGRSNKPWTQAEVEYLVRRRHEKATAEQIGVELGRSWNAINAMIGNLRKLDVPVPMLGNGVHKLWDADLLKATFADAKGEDSNIVSINKYQANKVQP